MRRQWFVWAVLVLGAIVLWSYSAARAQEPAAGTKAPAALQAEPQAFPPGWQGWGPQQKKEWVRRLERAKQQVRERQGARLNAALESMDAAAREGVPVEDAAEMARIGLDNAVEPAEFGPLGKFVTARVGQGLRGQALADVIHREVQLRRQARRLSREQQKARTAGRGEGVGNAGRPPEGGGRLQEEERQEEGRGQARGRGAGGASGRGRGRN